MHGFALVRIALALVNRRTWLALLSLLVAFCLLLCATIAAGVALLIGVFRGGAGQPGGPVYQASCQGGAVVTIQVARVQDLCFGPSDAARLARTIAAIRPDSPLVGRAGTIVQLGQRFGVDPLLIVQWQGESGMATVVPPVSANGADNGGNLTWAAAEPYAATWGCTPGAAVHYPDGSYLFARCPSVEAGIGLWFNYVGERYPAARYPNLQSYANTYNSCAYPGNEANGFLCGDAYAKEILNLLRQYAGAPAAPAVGSRFASIVGGLPAPISQEFGHTPYSQSAEGRAIYDYGRYYGLDGASHPGVDVGVSDGTPLYSPVGGVVEIAGGSCCFRDETGQRDPATSGELRIRLENGDLLILGHLSAITVRVGQRVAPGTPVGRSGTANGPHVHVEVRVVDPTLPSGYRIVDPRPYLG